VSYKTTIQNAGFKGKLMFHTMRWTGEPGKIHRVNRYSDIDPVVTKNKLQLVKLAGGDGVVMTWLGPGHSFIHEATMIMAEQCLEQGLLFAILLDPNIVSSGGMASALTDPGLLSMVASDAYIPEKALLDFSTGTDFTKVTLPPGVVIWSEQKDYAWINAYDGDNARSLTELQNVQKLPSMKMAFLCSQFNDGGFPQPAGVSAANFKGSRDYGHRVWGNGTLSVRAIDHQDGNFFHDTVAALSLCPNAPYVGMVLDDSDEQAGCLHFLSQFFGIRVGQ
jgi:hypothetical protein